MRNTPKLISDYQGDVLKILANAYNIEEFYGCLGEVFRVLRRYVSDLQEAKVDSWDRVFTVGVTKHLSDYRVNNFSYAALRQFEQEGVKLLPGQSICYIVTDQQSRRFSEKVKITEAFEDGDSYDARFYIEHMIKATESLLLPFGYTINRLRAILSGRAQSTLMEFL